MLTGLLQSPCPLLSVQRGPDTLVVISPAAIEFLNAIYTVPDEFLKHIFHEKFDPQYRNHIFYRILIEFTIFEKKIVSRGGLVNLYTYVPRLYLVPTNTNKS